jgi:hypothetical protein
MYIYVYILLVPRLFPARPNENLLTDKCEFCFDFKIVVNIICVCVLFHKNHAGTFSLTLKQWQLIVCLKATHISCLVLAAKI